MPSLRQAQVRHARHYLEVLRALKLSLRANDDTSSNTVDALNDHWSQIQAARRFVETPSLKDERPDLPYDGLVGMQTSEWGVSCGLEPVAVSCPIDLPKLDLRDQRWKDGQGNLVESPLNEILELYGELFDSGHWTDCFQAETFFARIIQELQELKEDNLLDRVTDLLSERICSLLSSKEIPYSTAATVLCLLGRIDTEYSVAVLRRIKLSTSSNTDCVFAREMANEAYADACGPSATPKLCKAARDALWLHSGLVERFLEAETSLQRVIEHLHKLNRGDLLDVLAGLIHRPVRCFSELDTVFDQYFETLFALLARIGSTTSTPLLLDMVRWRAEDLNCVVVREMAAETLAAIPDPVIPERLLEIAKNQSVPRSPRRCAVLGLRLLRRAETDAALLLLKRDLVVCDLLSDLVSID
jgi:hypothetical protein